MPGWTAQRSLTDQGPVRGTSFPALPQDGDGGQDSLPGVDVEPPPETAASPTIAAPSPNLPSPSFNLFDEILGGSGDPLQQNSGVLRSSGSPFDQPLAVSVRDRAQIQERQAADMFHALQNEVGILMQSTAAGQASPFVRGLTGQQVLLLVDGIRMNNSVYRFGPNQYFNTIDPGMVEQIEVHRGPASVLWGSDALGGAINVITRSADVHYGMFHGDYSGGDFTQYYNTANNAAYSRVNVEGWVNRWGYFGGGSYQNVHDLDTGWDFGRQPGTNYDQWAADIKLNYLLGPNQMLTFSAQHFQLDDVPRSDRFPGYPGDVNNSNSNGGARFFDPQQRDLMYVRYQAVDLNPLIDALTITGSYHRQRDVQRRGIPTSRTQETDVDTTGVSLVASRDYGHFGKLTLGSDWYHDHVDSQSRNASNIIPDDSYYERFGVFLNWDVQLTQRLAANAGVRYEHIDLASLPTVDSQQIFISPSYDDWVGYGGLVYELMPCVHLVGSISEGFRAPNLDELTANNPNVLQQGQDLPSLDLIPENAVSYEVGMKTRAGRLRAEAYVFWTDIDNNIVPVVAAQNQFTRDNQDSSIQGVEFNGQYLLSRHWSLYGNFWYTYGRNEITGNPLSRIPPAQGIVGLRKQQGKSYFDMYTWLVRRQDRLDPVRDIGDERIPAGGTPGYATLNIRMGRAFGEWDQHRVSLSLENLTDKNYLVHGSGVFGTGFTARMGYTYEF